MPAFSKNFLGTYSDIKSIRIQGAEQVAWRGSIAAADEMLRELEFLSEKTYSQKKYLDIANSVKHRMLSARPTEPALNNAITLLLGKSAPKTQGDAIMRIRLMRKNIDSHFKGVYADIAKHSQKELSKYNSCYTHCHSSLAVTAILAAGIKVVHNTETRPLYQGRKTAKELAKRDKKIIVHHYVDSAMRTAISSSECVIIGADSITMRGDIINKIGTGILGMVAEEMKKPVYVIADSFKLDLHSIRHDTVIEERPSREIWPASKAKPANVLVHNPAFEKIKAGKIRKIICESGSYTPKEFVKYAQTSVKPK